MNPSDHDGLAPQTSEFFSGGEQASKYQPPDSNSARGTFMLVFVLLVFVVWGVIRPSQRWEYKIENIPDEGFQTEIDKLGDGGWELVFARRASSEVGDPLKDKPKFSYEMIFKRPLGIAEHR